MDHIILDYLRKHELTEEEAIALLGWVREYKRKKAGKAAKYYQKNRPRLDAYHDEYTKNNPEYRDKAKERAKRYKRKK